MDVPLSPWTIDLFGDQAHAVRAGLGQAFRNMQANAQAAQEQTNARTNHAFGSSRWSGQFERVWDELKGLPGAQPVKPHGFAFELMLVGRGLLYPFLYSKTKADVRDARIPSESMLIRELFAFAPARTTNVQGVFDFDILDVTVEPITLRGGLTSVPPETRLVLVPFACNTSELLEAHWGVAALGAERRLDWVTGPEALPLPDAVTFHGQRLTSVPAQSDPAVLEHTSFDQGAKPTLTLSSRPNVDRKRDVTPLTEAEPMKLQANEDDATH
ncbi:hypothetical protein GCM10010430_55310 [Kitasatospora cystarginea]|uniref:Uncharacterized protein n=1 Tax=Kitasatospora cystarginea TaxID=58350 RepID=A0ABN3EMH6_9ACTN